MKTGSLNTRLWVERTMERLMVGNRVLKALLAVAVMAIALGGAASRAQDKDSFTPMALDSGFGRLDPAEPTTPAEEIIKKFAAKESEFQDALNHYTYRRFARVQT